MRERKMDYEYGARVEAIRKVAKRGRPFNVEDVAQAKAIRRQLGKMVENGEIRRIIYGTRGRYRTVYQIV